jgi:hypothetical protein
VAKPSAAISSNKSLSFSDNACDNGAERGDNTIDLFERLAKMCI